MTSHPVFMDTLPAVYKVEVNGMVPLFQGDQAVCFDFRPCLCRFFFYDGSQILGTLSL